MRLQASRRLHFRFNDGPDVVLLPDHPMDVPAETAHKLLALASEHLQVLPERDVPLPRRDHDASSSIKPGWFITFERDGVLVGGPDAGDLGRVWKCVRDPTRRLRVYTHAGFAVEEAAITGVTEVDAAGHPKAVWITSAHGFDGQREQDDPLPTLASHQSVSYVPDMNVCFSCGGRRFWISVYGATICESCHPPADPRLIERWTDGPEHVVTYQVIDCRRRELRDLSPAQRRQVMDAYGWSREELDALTTGIWPDEVWKSFWQRDNG